MNRPRLILVILSFVLLCMVCFAYWNHFHNPFQFDDNHTIVSNMYIRDVKNIPKFFTDATTTSSLPANQAYRPGLTALNAIDYWLSGEKGEPQPLQFHISIFISFLILGIFIYFFSLKIFNLTGKHLLNPFIALLVSAVYLLHTGNAETITYIISRTDSFSTLMMMVALCVFAYQKGIKRYIWYLLPMTFGFFVKEPAVMVGPLALLFVLLFEEQLSVSDFFKKIDKAFRVFLKLLPAFIMAFLLFGFAKYMTPKTWTSGNDQYVPYWLTQTFVVVHYVTDYFLPFNLSADTDWSLIRNPFDDRVLIGIVFIVFTLWLAYRCSSDKEARPVTYGILWFYICLIPTSLFPFAEVLNDHRVFLPYIGLTIAVVWGAFILYSRYGSALDWYYKVILNYFRISGRASRKEYWMFVLFNVIFALITLFADNVFDITFKREVNGALKNSGYGYISVAYFLLTIIPSIAVLVRRLHDVGKSGLWYFFGLIPVIGPIWLFVLLCREGDIGKNNYGVNPETQTPQINYGIKISIPVTLFAVFLTAHMFGVRERCKVWSSGTNLWADVVVKSPHNGRGLMNYGNALMGQGDYKGALEYFNKAKQEWPYYSYIYTNLGVLYSSLGNPQEAEKNFLYARQLNGQNPEFYYFYADFLRHQKRYSEALQMVNVGLALSPQHPSLNSLKNDLLSNPQYAAREQDRVQMAEKQAKDSPTPENWLNLSLIYYNAQRYQDCVNAAQEALKLRPNYDLAYNNICSAYNVLHEWDKAIEAGKKAVELNPTNTLAKNNLQASLNGKIGK